MAGKSCVLASRHLSYALEKLSKNTLIDLVVDMTRGTVGENASDVVIARSLQPFIDAVLRMRSDRPMSLEAAVQALITSDERYRALHN